MIKNFLKIAFRNLLKRKVYSLINVFGLATGMAVCLLIMLFILDELSFDKFHKNSDNIYRIALDRKYPGRSTSYSIIPLSIGEAMKKEYPEVIESVRLFDANGENGNLLVRIGDKSFEEKQVLFADSNFFRVFSVQMEAGKAADALEKSNTVVLSGILARKYFGSPGAAIGKTLLLEGGDSWTVTGVVKDWPVNSHFHFTMLVSANTLRFIHQPNYTGFSAHTYLLLSPQADAKALEAKFPAFIEKYIAGPAERSFGVPFKQFQAAGNGYHYYLQPLTQIHLTSDLEAELSANGSIKVVYIFSLIALFIMFLACINFINLSTARSMERAKEVGIRKTFGSERKMLIFQFLSESVLVSLLSCLLALGLIFLLLPSFNQLAGKELTMHYFFQPVQIALLLAFAILIGMVAGIYPAFVLSSFRPVVVLKGKFTTNRIGLLLRNSLVVLQFTISVILIIATVVVNQQMQYCLGEKTGFKKDHIIVIERTDLLAKQSDAFKNELRMIPGVEAVAGNSSMPGQQNFFGLTFQAIGAKEPMTGRGIVVDEQYASALGLQIAKGRFFSKEFITDSLALVVNEKAVGELGLKDPVGARLTSPDEGFNEPGGKQNIYTIVGVVKDFHFQSLHQKISPLVIINSSKFKDVNPFTAVRIGADQFSNAVPAIGKKWTAFVKERTFHYSFFDQQLAELYHSEQRTRRIFTAFSILAIFIGCIGLFGLVTYATQQRIREISIRKIMGASISNIFSILSKDFLKLVLIASCIAFPLAWWLMHKWLEGFAYRITIGWWIFVLAGLLATLIALITISIQAVKAALTNPVKSLRTE